MSRTARLDQRKGQDGTARSAAEIAYTHIREEILGDPGSETSFLAEESVASALGMSRTPVREAFLRLAADGLLTLIPRKGAVVVPMTDRQMREVMEVRSVVEAWSVERVLGNPAARDRLVAGLRENQARLESLGWDADPARFIECDRAFHRGIVQASGNRVMLDLYERMRDQQMRIGVRAVAGHPERMEEVRREHGAIVDALAGGDPELALASVARHLDATAENVMTRDRA